MAIGCLFSTLGVFFLKVSLDFCVGLFLRSHLILCRSFFFYVETSGVPKVRHIFLGDSRRICFLIFSFFMEKSLSWLIWWMLEYCAGRSPRWRGAAPPTLALLSATNVATCRCNTRASAKWVKIAPPKKKMSHWQASWHIWRSWGTINVSKETCIKQKRPMQNKRGLQQRPNDYLDMFGVPEVAMAIVSGSLFDTCALPPVRCKTLQDTARHCKTLQDTATHCNTHSLQHMCRTSGTMHKSVQSLQHTATHCNTLQHTHLFLTCAVPPVQCICLYSHCNTLQYTATHIHCNTLRYTATHT